MNVKERILKGSVNKLMEFIYTDPNKVAADSRTPNYLCIASLVLEDGPYGYAIDNYILGEIRMTLINSETIDIEHINKMAVEFCKQLRLYYINNLNNILKKYNPSFGGYSVAKGYTNLIKAIRPRASSEILSFFGATGLKGEIVDLFNRKINYDITFEYLDNKLAKVDLAIR